MNFNKIIQTKIKLYIRKHSVSKRQQLIFISFILTVFMLFTLISADEYRYLMILFLGILTYGLTAFGLRDDLAGIEWFSLMSLPTLYSMVLAIFYFFLPVRWLTRVPFLVFYGLTIYAVLLTENIYNVAANRTIALLRAAHTIGFIVSLLVFFLFATIVFYLRLPFFLNSILMFIFTFILSLQFFWSILLTPNFGQGIVKYAFILAVIIAEFSLVVSFLPISSTFICIGLTTVFYSFSGITQQYLMEKLYKRTVNEFYFLLGLVFIILSLGIHWRGI